MSGRIAGALGVAAAGASALAQHAGDIVLDTSSGAITTNVFGGALSGECVFVMREFGDGQTNDPGFDSLTGAFGQFEPVGFDLLAALRKWDGADFDTIPAEQIRVTSGFFGPVFTPMSDQTVTGFSLDASSAGQWHEHLLFTLTSPASDGVYLVQVRLWAGVGGAGSVQPSEPFWLVFDKNASADVAAATQWVRDELSWCDAGPCPADLTGEGDVNVNDFFLFLSLYQAQDARADFAAGGGINVNDFFAFLAAYQAGC